MLEIVAEIEFNRDDDGKEFGSIKRVVYMNCFTDEGKDKIALTFFLGRKEDDTSTLVFDIEEFFCKAIRAIRTK